MASDGAGRDLRERILAEKGRHVYRLARLDNLDPEEIYEARGRIRALSGVLHYLDNAEDVEEEPSEEFIALGDADQKAVEEVMAGDDGEDSPNPVGVQ